MDGNRFCEKYIEKLLGIWKKDELRLAVLPGLSVIDFIRYSTGREIIALFEI